MRRFVTVDLSIATVTLGQITANPDWLTRAGLAVDDARTRSLILSNGGEDEFYIAVSVGQDYTQFTVVRTSANKDQAPYNGECDSVSDTVTREINQAIQNITAGWQPERLPDDEPDPVMLMAASTTQGAARGAKRKR